MFKKIVLAMIVVLGSSSAFAAGYADAGCGLGSLVFKNKQGWSQVLAATTNGTFGSQTFGITSGTSNCSASIMKLGYFIDSNKPALKSDIARGHGETLNSLSELYNCQNSAAFNSALKENYGNIFSSNETQAIEGKIEALSTTCNA